MSLQEFAAYIIPVARSAPEQVELLAPAVVRQVSQRVESWRLHKPEGGVTIQFESHRVERPAIYELKHDRTSWSYVLAEFMLGRRPAWSVEEQLAGANTT